MMLQDTEFNFEFQEGKTLDRVELKTGDSMTTECDYRQRHEDSVMLRSRHRRRDVLQLRDVLPDGRAEVPDGCRAQVVIVP